MHNALEMKRDYFSFHPVIVSAERAGENSQYLGRTNATCEVYNVDL